MLTTWWMALRCDVLSIDGYAPIPHTTALPALSRLVQEDSGGEVTTSAEVVELARAVPRQAPQTHSRFRSEILAKTS
jgi:hypothetical protein